MTTLPVFEVIIALRAATSEEHTVDPAYNDIGLYDTPSIPSGITRYQLIPHC